MAAVQDREQIHRVEVGVRADGTLVSLIDRFVYDAGATIPYGLLVGCITVATTPGPYKIPHLLLQCRAALTHKAPIGAYRGAGRPQGVYVMERVIDEIARRLDLDPLTVRERNFIQPDEFPYVTGLTGQDNLPQVYDSGNYPEALEMIRTMIGYEEFRTQQAEARRHGRYLGLGIACYVEACGVGPYEGATVSLGPDGRVTVITGAPSQGQGHETVLAQVAADQLGVDPADVTVLAGDTAAIPFGVGTYASRVAVTAGNATLKAAGQVRQQALQMATRLLEAKEQDLECAGGQIRVKGARHRGISLAEAARAAMPGRGSMPLPGQPGLTATEYFEPGPSTSASGVHACIVAIDPRDCVPRILRYMVVHDCGVVLNPLIVEGQVHGGVAQGIGGSLYEKIVYDGNGQLLTGSLMDYLMPTAMEVPHLEVAHQQHPSPFNPLGAKGAGEGGTIPVYAAIAGAVEDALSPVGVVIRTLPLMPADVYALIENSRRK